MQIRIFAVWGSGHHILQRIGTKFPAKLKFSNADFVHYGARERKLVVFSERELAFAICCRPSVCLSVCLSVVCLSVMLVHLIQAVVIFRNISTAFGTLAIL